MSSPHKVYTEEFKWEAVRLSYESGLTIIEVASDLGIGRSTLNTWRREFRDDYSPVATSEESSDAIVQTRSDTYRFFSWYLSD